MVHSLLTILNFLLDPHNTLVCMLVVLTLLTGTVFFLPSHNLTLIRAYGLAVSFVPLYWSLYLWAQYDASGHSLQYVVSLGSVHWLGAPLSFGLDAVSLSLTVLTTALFPLCILLMRTLSGVVCFLLLEVVILGALSVLDLLGFYILFESSLILLFRLIARTPYGSLDAAYKLVLYTLAGSLLLLPVILVLYMECGSTNLLQLMCASSNVFSVERQMLLGWGLLAVFAVKVPLIPVHLWLPEAHVAAPTAGSILLAGVLLKLGGVGFIRFMIPMLPAFTAQVFPLVCTICLISYLYASFSTLRQVDLKKVVAYSSIAHMALVTIALFSVSEMAVYSSTYMMIAHGIVSPALFYLVGCIYDRAHTKVMLYLKGMGTHMPMLTTMFLVFTMANVGLPLTPNFIAEVLCLASLFAVSELLAFVFCGTQVLAAAYGFWCFNRVAHGHSTGLGQGYVHDLTRLEFSAVMPLFIATVWLGVKPMA
jgi:proton-translocating NADH-quinone oxidoreductase chain M